MAQLCRTLAALEESLLALERRGISLRAHAARQDPATGRLPDLPRLPRPRRSTGSPPASELDAFRRPAGSRRPARSCDVGRQPTPATATATATARPPRTLHIVELHEVRSINTQLADLREDGLRRSTA